MERIFERFRVESRVGSYSFASPTPPTPPRTLTKEYPRWGWMGRACETTREPTTPTKTFGRPVLEENSHYDNARMATVLIRLLLWLSKAYFKLYRVEREVLAPFSVGRAYAFYTFLYTS